MLVCVVMLSVIDLGRAQSTLAETSGEQPNFENVPEEERVRMLLHASRGTDRSNITENVFCTKYSGGRFWESTRSRRLSSSKYRRIPLRTRWLTWLQKAGSWFALNYYEEDSDPPEGNYSSVASSSLAEKCADAEPK